MSSTALLLPHSFDPLMRNWSYSSTMPPFVSHSFGVGCPPKEDFCEPFLYGKNGFVDESMKSDGFLNYGHTATEPSSTQNSGDGEWQWTDGGVGLQGMDSLSFPPLDPLSCVSTQEFTCPCCGMLSAGGSQFHSHVTQCYLSKYLPHSSSSLSTTQSSVQSEENAPSPHSDPSECSLGEDSAFSAMGSADPPSTTIASLRACVGQLDIHQRISLMEAFHRLSRETAAQQTDSPLHGQNRICVSNTDDSPIESSQPSPMRSVSASGVASCLADKPFHVDEKVISLLYSPAHASRSRFSSPVPSTVSMAGDNHVATTPLKRAKSTTESSGYRVAKNLNFHCTVPLPSTCSHVVVVPSPVSCPVKTGRRSRKRTHLHINQAAQN